MANPLVLSLSEARQLAFLASSGGAAPTSSDDPATSTGSTKQPNPVHQAAEALERLGYVQIDTISVVERAHHHILWSRDRNYRPPVLPVLESEPRQIFEYWAHAAAYLPMSDYRYCLPRMRRIAANGHEWFASDPRTEDWVRDRIRAEGPLRSQDFENKTPRGTWWDWKPAKAALEYLFQAGELMVVARPGFQKLYDLTARVLPPGTDTSRPSEEEMGDWYVRRAASALGVFTLRDIAYQRRDATAGIAAALERACEEGLILPCMVRGAHTGPDGLSGLATEQAAKPETLPGKARRGRAHETWCASGLLSGLASAASLGTRDDSARVGTTPAALGNTENRLVRILSPFDNLIIDRRRANRLFGLEYTLECYTPAAKRKFGYFALPVFLGTRPVGLIDCKADRKIGKLVVNRARFDWGNDPAGGPEGFPEAYSAELAAFASFNGCQL